MYTLSPAEIRARRLANAEAEAEAEAAEEAAARLRPPPLPSRPIRGAIPRMQPPDSRKGGPAFPALQGRHAAIAFRAKGRHDRSEDVLSPAQLPRILVECKLLDLVQHVLLLPFIFRFTQLGQGAEQVQILRNARFELAGL